MQQTQTVRCPECGREFPTQQALQEHVNRDHMGTMTDRGGLESPSAGEPQEECPSCSTEFPSGEALEEHRRQAHAGEPASKV
jgi:uncharacterized C2H2 Zn-finger protein